MTQLEDDNHVLVRIAMESYVRAWKEGRKDAWHTPVAANGGGGTYIPIQPLVNLAMSITMHAQQSFEGLPCTE